MYIQKIKNGIVELYGERGYYKRSIGVSDATSARSVGADIAITRRSGRVEIYYEKGCYKRHI